MKNLLMVGACALAALCLAGCNGIGGLSLPGAGGSSTANNALGTFLSDPNCAHHDEASFVSGAGGLPASFQAKVMRDCPAHAPPVTTGQILATPAPTAALPQ